MMYANVIGRLTADPVIKSQDMVTGSIAFSSGYKKETSFINYASFGKTAEFIEKYLKKGSQAFFIGSIRQNTWTDKEGNKRSDHQFVIDKVEFIYTGKKKENAEQTEPDQGW